MQASCHNNMSGKASTLKPLRPSNLIRSSVEALEVAIDQYSEGTPKRNRDCVENCDKAVELILKAKVIRAGESVYYPGSTNTIKMHESFAKLRKKGIIIPEENTLTNNHKFSRNPSYHEGRTVSKATTKSILDTTRKFIERFLKDEFNLKLKELIKPQYVEVLDHVGTKTGQLMKIVSEGHATVNRLDQARVDVPKDYETIEIYLNKLAKKKKLKIGGQQKWFRKKSGNDRSLLMSKIIDALVADQTLSEDMRNNFDTINKMYYKAVNTQDNITWDDYNPYGLASMRLKAKLEICLS
jgi:hypothetical protein